jgi:hypothetical protein
MPAILRFFWFLCAAFMTINIVIWRGRLASLVSQGTATQAEADRFVRWAALGFVAVPVVLGIIGLAAGWSSPFCAGILAFDSIPRLLTSVVSLTSWLALLYWVWRGSGAEFLARVGPALGKHASYGKTYSPRTARAYVTIVLIISSVGGVVAFRSMPLPPDMGCATATPVR